MQNNNPHHGRASQQAAPPTDPRTDPRTRRVEERNAPTTPAVEGICRDYIWGICQMGSQCKYRHKLDLDVMKAVLKFCHDHQNRTGCLRPDCTYLHTSREEEIAFLTTGQVPLMLAERYTALHANESVQGMPCPNMAGSSLAGPSMAGPSLAGPSMVGPSLAGPSMAGSSMPGPSMPAPVPPPHMLYEYLVQPPPPPPPPPAPVQNVAPQLPMQGPQNIPPKMQGPQNIPPQMQGPQQIQGPMMPHHMLAPPPPPPPTVATTTLQMAGPAYTAPIPSTSRALPGMYSSQQPPLLPIFDPTRPPPPLHSQNIHSCKRTHSDDSEAGPSKVRKAEPAHESCDLCIQRLLRCNIYTQQIELQQEQNEQLRAAIGLKMDTYERKKMLLRSLVRPEVYRRTEDFVESGSTMPLPWNPEPVSPPSVPSTSANLVHQLLELLLNKSRSETREPVQSEDINRLLQTAVGRMRSNSNGQSSSDNIDAILEIISNLPTERVPALESRSEDITRNVASNGLSRFLGEREASPPNAARYARRSFAEAGVARSFGESGPPAPPPVPLPAPARAYGEGAPALNVAGPSSRAYADSAPGPSGHAYTEPPAPALPYLDGRSYSEAASGAPRYPPAMAVPPRQYHPGLFEGATVPTTAPPPHYMPGPYSSPPTQQQPATRANYYGHFPPPNNMPNQPYPTPGHVTHAPRPSTSGTQTLPQNAQNYPHFMGRYPNPSHFYPPYQ